MRWKNKKNWVFPVGLVILALIAVDIGTAVRWRKEKVCRELDYFFRIKSDRPAALLKDLVGADAGLRQGGLSGVGAVSSTRSVTVAVVQSDDAELPDPEPIDQPLSEQQVEEMVRRAVELAGGIGQVIEPGDDWVVLKPNLVELEAGLTNTDPGVCTDYRVVRAMAKIIDEVDHGNIKISVCEAAPGWIMPELPQWIKNKYTRPQEADGYQVLDYRDMETELLAEGIDIECISINYNTPGDPKGNMTFTPVSSPWYVKDSYWLHNAILQCDKYVTVPVMKIHVTGITVALKNQIGLLPGVYYGWGKWVGGIDPGDPTIHEGGSSVTDEEILDVCSLRPFDYVLVDAINCREYKKSFSGICLRRNTIVAGADPVAVDSVCARLMRCNEDDVEHISLGAIKGLGTNDFSQINVAGNTIEDAGYWFRKSKDSDEYGNYGCSNRTWLLKLFTPFDWATDHLAGEGGEAGAGPRPEENGWSPVVYFWDDHLDLESYFGGQSSAIAYAFTWFNSPAAMDDAELWVGSTDKLKVWINGSVAHEYSGGKRAHYTPNTVVTGVTISQGMNRLLVKVGQNGAGDFEFSLNICEPVPDDVPDPAHKNYYDGNRVLGLKFVPNPVYSFSGTVNFEYPGFSTGTATVRYQVRNPGLPPTEPVYEDTLTVSMTTGYPATGSFTIPEVYLGTYDVALKHCNHPAGMVPGVVAAGADVTGLSFTLWAGDADGDDNVDTVYPGDPEGDNDVDLSDYYTLYYQYVGGLPVTTGYNSDFNGDGNIDLADYYGLYYGYQNASNPGNWY